MNVFEDLVEELKVENLLEMTVIDAHNAQNVNDDGWGIVGATVDTPVISEPENSGEVSCETAAETEYPALNVVEIENIASQSKIDSKEDLPELVESIVSNGSSLSKESKNDGDFFKRRAAGEISSLQMVEHVITGIEREYMKIVPKTFDDLNAKKALNVFLHLADNANLSEQSASEFKLMQETEAWCSAVATRDRNVSVSNLRRYCENSRPALSSHALVGLSRFYRNLPYSETVRAKFDFVITRLFSRAVESEKRKCLFNREDMLGHINTLYGEWSSVPLYAADDEDESKVMLTALSFEDLAIEAENSSAFDQLIESDFFGRLRLFKESISELFFAPQVTAAAIECNIRIGNVYVALINREREKMDAASIQSKYGDLNGQTVSEAAGRSLEIVDMLRELSAQPDDVDPVEPHESENEIEDIQRAVEAPKPKAATSKAAISADTPTSFLARVRENAFSTNKWFLAVALVLIAASAGLYVWANYFVSENINSVGVGTVIVEDSILQEHLKLARVSGENFYGQLLPSWDVLPKEKRQEFLQSVLKIANENGCTQVTLINKDGKTAGYASATRLDVVMP